MTPSEAAAKQGFSFFPATLPQRRETIDLLLNDGVEKLPRQVKDVLLDLLVHPAEEMASRPSHGFRSELVHLGFLLMGSDKPHGSQSDDIDVCAASIELLHLGSLIVDDIQDGSTVRRKGKSLHELYGTAKALAIGNWLYFHALRLLHKLHLPLHRKLALIDFYHSAVEVAHYGQALDLGASIHNVAVRDIPLLSEKCMSYKTGVISMLAAGLGAFIADDNEEKLSDIKRLAHALGLYLQRFNDLGNFLGTFDQQKVLEDLRSGKLSFVSSFILQQSGPDVFQRFNECVNSDDLLRLDPWRKNASFTAEARRFIENEYHIVVERFITRWGESSNLRALTMLQDLQDRIAKAYV